jgi:hypothetical protein
MDERARRRLAVARKVCGATRNPEFRDCLPIVDSSGERHIVIALRDDSLGYVFDRVEECGGAANIVVDLGISVAVIAVTPDSPDAPDSLDDMNASSPLHDDAPTEMLLLLLRDYGPQRCRRLRPHMETRLVGERELIGI